MDVHGEYWCAEGKIVSLKQTIVSVLALLVLATPYLAYGNGTSSPLCDHQNASELFLEAEKSGIIVLDRSRLKAYLLDNCGVGEATAITTKPTAQKNLEDTKAMATASLNQTRQSEPVKTLATHYYFSGAADLSRGNRDERDYDLAAKRDQALTAQLLWEFDVDYTLREDFYTIQFFTEDNTVETQRYEDTYHKFTLNNDFTYQSTTNPKLIGFTNINYSRDDFAGIERDTSIMFGGGYAIWGDNYHAPCEVFKYSAGVGQRDRNIVDEDDRVRDFVSHKFSLKYPLTDAICVSLTHTKRQFIGHSNENVDASSISSKFPINAIMSITARYLYKHDKGVKDGREAIDERLRLGVEAKF